MSKDTERIATLEEFKTTYSKIFGAVVAGAVAWLTYVTITLSALKGDVKAIEQKIADNGLGVVVAQLEHPKSGQQLTANLGLITSQISVARANGQPPKAENLVPLSKAVGHASYSNPELLQVWQAAFSLVTYRSEEHQQQDPANFPDCLAEADHAIQQFRNSPDADPPGKTTSFFALNVKNCILNLDVNNDFEKTSAADFFREVKARFPNLPSTMTLTNAVVVYSGGGVIPVESLTFTNCRFVFNAPFSVPPKTGQALTDQLLVSDLTSAVVRLPSGM